MAKMLTRPCLFILIVLSSCMLFNFHSVAQTVEVTLPDTTATEGSTISIPVLCNDVTGLGVYSYGFKIEYDQSIITATGVAVDETISLPWGAPTFNIGEGTIFIAAAGSAPLNGEGVLLFIDFSINGTVGNITMIQFTEAMFNEGEPMAVTTNGNLEVVPPTTVKPEPAIPGSFKISPAYPNPFNPSTTVEYELLSKSRITISVYDELGRFINTLIDESMDMGCHTITWDGYDQSHREVSSGIYFINISAGNTITTISTLKVVKLN
ncbi:T9SS type A sorting domain-containing protein [candidate division KSB1 bacterium]|nr:T9SS type A sorting domain-containing protein [candidate division KSB1 bacterium]